MYFNDGKGLPICLELSFNPFKISYFNISGLMPAYYGRKYFRIRKP